MLLIDLIHRGEKRIDPIRPRKAATTSSMKYIDGACERRWKRKSSKKPCLNLNTQLMSITEIDLIQVVIGRIPHRPLSKIDILPRVVETKVDLTHRRPNDPQ